VLLRPLPYPEPDRLVQMREVGSKGGQMRVAEPNYGDVRDNIRSFESVAQYNNFVTTVTGASEPARARMSLVSGAFFRVLGVQPQAGRAFLPEENKPGGNAVAVVSHGFWQRLLGGRQDFSSTTLKIDSQNYTVVGVMPPGFDFPGRTEIWVARELFPLNTSRTAHNWNVIGRLADGVSLAQARTEVSGLGRQLKQQYGKDMDAVDFVLTHSTNFWSAM
jgi:putative ABC transport system permease protein